MVRFIFIEIQFMVLQSMYKNVKCRLHKVLGIF